MRVTCPVVISGLFGVINLALADLRCDSNQTNVGDLMESERVLSRSRRYLAFPKSSSFVVTLTGLKSIQVKEPTNWNLDLEFDMIWPIPSETVKKLPKKPMKKFYSRLRRHKRDLYSNIEISLNRLGLPGRDCMLRTICEARGFLYPPGVSFIDDLLRVILSHGEHSAGELDLYDVAYKSAEECDIQYKCPISFLQFLLNNDIVVR
ncbi:uncharacterized protein LOC107036711 [Diachasma alloeum]|uniref:uncharacterized protein LOC107036711 n=1 Tax=Diachasma alloeum TaxID=454923 RepID=UPI0010FB3B90|nr:uncharacterized protein LOC107036711 [Diachasma alloeum]